MIKTVLTKIAAFFGAIGMGLSVIFYVLMRLAKEERKALEAENDVQEFQRIADAERAAREAEKAVAKKKAELEAEDEELNQRVHSGDSLDSFNAGIDMLRKQSERGNKRNSGAGNCGA